MSKAYRAKRVPTGSSAPNQISIRCSAELAQTWTTRWLLSPYCMGWTQRRPGPAWTTDILPAPKSGALSSNRLEFLAVPYTLVGKDLLPSLPYRGVGNNIMTAPNDTLERDDFIELALEYRDEMLKSLGVIGVEHAGSYSAPGEEIRRYPVETAGAHDGAGNTVGTHRVLTDVRHYDDPEHEIPSDDAVNYLTVRETTGYAAIQSSATMALGWSTIPTPREIRLAEHLNDLTESDVSPHHHRINRARAAEEIIEQIYPRDSRYDEADLWLPLEETSITNTIAVEECVAALRYGEDDENNHPIRFRNDYADADVDGPLDYRLSTPRGVIVDKYFDNPVDEYGSESWHRVYSGVQTSEIDADVEALGYISIDGDELDDGVETRVVTIPEMRKPEDVLDLPAPEPRAPPEEPSEED